MISFDVISLFTNVPLDITIDMILKKVYEEKLINTSIKREDMKSLLLLCAQNPYHLRLMMICTYKSKV